MTKTVPTNKARQGPIGWPVLIVLVCALALAAAVWWGVEIYGDSIADPQAGTAEEPGASGVATPDGTQAPATQ